LSDIAGGIDSAGRNATRPSDPRLQHRDGVMQLHADRLRQLRQGLAIGRNRRPLVPPGIS
jgi:hypothetical protein